MPLIECFFTVTGSLVRSVCATCIELISAALRLQTRAIDELSSEIVIRTVQSEKRIVTNPVFIDPSQLPSLSPHSFRTTLVTSGISA